MSVKRLKAYAPERWAIEATKRPSAIRYDIWNWEKSSPRIFSGKYPETKMFLSNSKRYMERKGLGRVEFNFLKEYFARRGKHLCRSVGNTSLRYSLRIDPNYCIFSDTLIGFLYALDTTINYRLWITYLTGYERQAIRYPHRYGRSNFDIEEEFFGRGAS